MASAERMWVLVARRVVEWKSILGSDRCWRQRGVLDRTVAAAGEAYLEGYV
jgi:hypothetical protein